MKPFLCIDITENKKNKQTNGKEFVSSTISLATKQSLDRVVDEVEKVEKKKGLPLPLFILQIIAAFVGFVFVRSLLRADVTVSQGYANAPGLFWAGGIAWVVFGILTLFGWYRKRKVNQSEENAIAESRADNMSNSINMELGVPSNAVDVDIITFSYKVKKGNPAPTLTGFNRTPYFNFSYKVFTENGNLCIADTENKYSIPANEIKGLRTVKTSIYVPMWNKNINFNEGQYKQYKIGSNDYGLCIRKHHILDVEHNGEKWGIYFPNYELPLFEYITGIKAE